MSKLKFSVGIGLQLLLATSMFIIGWYINSPKTLDKNIKTASLVNYAGIKTLISDQSGSATGFLAQTKNTANSYYESFLNVVKPSASAAISETPQNNRVDIYHSENDKSANYQMSNNEYKARLYSELIVMFCAISLLFGVFVQIKQRYDETHLAV